MPTAFEARREIVDVGRRIWERGYVAANDGNISVRLCDRVLVTPTGRSKGFLRPDEIVEVTLDGTPLSRGSAPTSELAMHLSVYATRPDVAAVVHAHPPNATAFAVAGVPLAQCVLPEVILSLGEIPLAGYATPTTEEVASSVSEHVSKFNAVLLRNHGALTLGETLSQAYFRMETVEHFARISVAAKVLGGAAPLSQEDVRKLLRVREQLGLPGETPACVSCGACDRGEVGAGTPEETLRAADTLRGTTGGPNGQIEAEDTERIVREVLARLERITGGGEK
jgi:L-fuculose-phosphate aldolase